MTKSKGPRKALALRLNPELFDLLTEFSELTGVARTDFIAGVLEQSAPHIKKLVAIARKAKSENSTSNPYLMASRLLGDLGGQIQQAQFELGAASETKPARRKAKGRNVR